MWPRTTRQTNHHVPNGSQRYSDGGSSLPTFAVPPFHVSQPPLSFPPPSFVGDGSVPMQPIPDLQYGVPYSTPYDTSGHTHQPPWLPIAPPVSQRLPLQPTPSTAHWFPYQRQWGEEPRPMHGRIPQPMFGLGNGPSESMVLEDAGRCNGSSPFQQFPHYPHPPPPARNSLNVPSGPSGISRPRGRGRRSRNCGMHGIGREFEGHTGQSIPHNNDGPGSVRGRGRNRGRGGKSAREGEAFASDMNLTQSVLERLGSSLPGSSPDEIEKWVEARKRNWPSRTNVARKAAEHARRQKAGDLMPNDRSGISRRRRHKELGSLTSLEKPVKASANRPEQSSAAVPKQVNVPSIPEPQPSVADNALSCIAAAYESSTDEECGGIAQRIEGKDDDCDVARRETHSNTIDDNRHDNTPVTGMDNRARNKRRNLKRKNRRNKRKAILIEKGTGPARTGLLRKLLDDEVRREQSILLQAFRYLLETDYTSERAERELHADTIGSAEMSEDPMK